MISLVLTGWAALALVGSWIALRLSMRLAAPTR